MRIKARFIVLITISGIFLLVSAAGSGDTDSKKSLPVSPSPGKTYEFMGMSYSYDVKDMPFIDFARRMQEETGFNFFVHDRAAGVTVTLKIENAPWDQILYLAMENAGLTSVEMKMKNTILIDTPEGFGGDAKKECEITPSNDRFRAYQRDINDIKRLLYPYLTPGCGVMVVDEKTGQIAVKDSEVVVAWMRDMFAKLDQTGPVPELPNPERFIKGAKPSSWMKNPRFTKAPISLDVANQPLREIIATLTRDGSGFVGASELLAATLTVKFKDLPSDLAVAAVLWTKNLQVISGDDFNSIIENTAPREHDFYYPLGRPSYPLEVFCYSGRPIQELTDRIMPLKTPRGVIAVDGASNCVVIEEISEVLSAMGKAMDSFNTGGGSNSSLVYKTSTWLEYEGSNRQKTALTLQDTEIAKALETLGKVGGVKVIVSDRVKGKIDVAAKEDTWDWIFNQIIVGYGLQVIYDQKSIMVLTPEEYLQKGTITKTIKPRSRRGEDLVPVLSLLLSPGVGKITYDASSQSLVITDIPLMIKKIEAVLALLDPQPK